LLEHKGVSVVNGRSPREVLSSAYESEYECVWNRSAKLSRSSAYTDLAEEAVDAACDVKFIAYYLPQYHPIHENDVWWGKGFTDWRNVTRAMPIYAGHYQPRLPGELGYYDLRLVETIRRQAELARLYGISAFCFHFYWFGGKRLLETPLLNFLKRKDIDLSFCLCWANENWTRRWDGRSDEVLIGQSHSPQDDLSFIEYLSKFFEDPRYLKVNDKPVLIVYRPALFPEITRTIERWRSAANKAGISGLHIVATNAFVFKDAASSGFDAIAEFPPHGVKAGLWSAPILAPEFSGKIFSYPEVVESATNSDTVSRVPIWPGAMPGWDNTPRMPQRGHLFHGSTPEFFETWLSDCIRRARHNPASERFVMINAWNEWAEGAYLEPDQYYGYAYLAACAGALKRAVKANVTVNLNTVNQGQRLDTAGMPAS
jgi:lipopolysaccharide biosynthesis protein